MSSEGLSQLPLKELKEYIQAYQLPSKTAIEKDDLVRIIFNTRPLSNENELSYRNQRHKLSSSRKNNSSFSFSSIVQDIFTPTPSTQPSPRPSPRQRPREQRTECPPEPRRPQYRPEQRSQPAPQPQQPEQRQPEQRQPAPKKEPIPRPELTLHDLVQTNTDASSLSVRTLKSILKANFVEQSHVIEKSELVKLVNRLADQERKTTGQPRDDVLCRICLDAEQNCVFLNCGHMAACMDCAKTLIETKNECPICREPILKLVHVFRS